MELPKLVFDHDKDSFIESLGLDQEDCNLARQTVLFEMLSVMVLQGQLDVEIPHAMTKSAVLERSLIRLKDNVNAHFLALVLFELVYRDTKDEIELVDKLVSGSKDGEDGIEVMKIKAHSLEDALKHIKKVMSSEKLVQMMSFLKDSKCDYQKFIDFTVHEKSRSELLGKSSKTEKKEKKKKIDFGDIDDIIRQAFLNKDDDEDDDN